MVIPGSITAEFFNGSWAEAGNAFGSTFIIGHINLLVISYGNISQIDLTANSTPINEVQTRLNISVIMFPNLSVKNKLRGICHKVVRKITKDASIDVKIENCGPYIIPPIVVAIKKIAHAVKENHMATIILEIHDLAGSKGMLIITLYFIFFKSLLTISPQIRARIHGNIIVYQYE